MDCTEACWQAGLDHDQKLHELAAIILDPLSAAVTLHPTFLITAGMGHAEDHRQACRQLQLHARWSDEFKRLTTAVMERAEARLQASIMTRSSMRWSFTGGAVGCTRNTSQPRMDSWTWT